MYLRWSAGRAGTRRRIEKYLASARTDDRIGGSIDRTEVFG